MAFRGGAMWGFRGRPAKSCKGPEGASWPGRGSMWRSERTDSHTDLNRTLADGSLFICLQLIGVSTFIRRRFTDLLVRMVGEEFFGICTVCP